MAKDSHDLFTWQIGSRKPPSFCLCCGLKFTDDRARRGPFKGPYIYVCSVCWEAPHLFFPDKVDRYKDDDPGKKSKSRKLASREQLEKPQAEDGRRTSQRRNSKPRSGAALNDASSR